MEKEKFNKNKCLDTINNLKKFYETDKFKNDHRNNKE